MDAILERYLEKIVNELDFYTNFSMTKRVVDILDKIESNTRNVNTTLERIETKLDNIYAAINALNR